MNRASGLAWMIAAALVGRVFAASPSTARFDEPHTCFQTAAPWSPACDIQTDEALVYGVTPDLAARLRAFADQGYRVGMMTGVAWGGYGDYVDGKFDGVNHMDDAQVRRDGSKVMHDASTPYFVPSPTYVAYLKTKLAAAIDGKADSLFLEEPEFWAFSGYSDGFKRAYKRFYGRDWVAPDSSVDARFQADRLKYEMYHDAIGELFHYAKAYGKQHGRSIRCYVATHSLISYAQIRMVSPMSSLMNLPDCDGYIAQVWTGTARHPNAYDGVTKERTFETAYLEYAQTMSMVRPTGRTCYLLADPVEDDPNHGWDDYEANYKRTLVASLMQQDAAHFEVCPWPDRIFDGRYFATEADARLRDTKNPPARIPIPPAYASVLQTCFNALAQMRADDGKFDNAPSVGVGVLVSDTLMFQRDEPSPSDPDLNNVFGLAMPLLKTGWPVKIVQLETLASPDALKGIDVLTMTYEGMKPLDAKYHDLLARWVHGGGAIVIVDDGRDPYNAVRGWWNQHGLNFPSPLDHLLQTLGVPHRPGIFDCGKGKVVFLADAPSALAHNPHGGAVVRGLVKAALDALHKADAWKERSGLVLRRGGYVVAANMDESPVSAPLVVRGTMVDLFDAKLPVITDPMLRPGEVGLWRIVASVPAVLASSSRIRDAKSETDRFTFDSRGPSGIACTTRVRLAFRPKTIAVTDAGKPVPFDSRWDGLNSTLLLTYANAARAFHVELRR